MSLDCTFGDVEALSDPAVAHPRGDQLRHLALAAAQRASIDYRFGLPFTHGVVDRLFQAHTPALRPGIFTFARPKPALRPATGSFDLAPIPRVVSERHLVRHPSRSRRKPTRALVAPAPPGPAGQAIKAGHDANLVFKE